MKLLYMTDTHIKPENPKSRKDDFKQALRNKFLDIKELIDEEKIDYVLHGGDLFDRPDVPIEVVSDFLEIMQSFGVPIYMIAGNHDMFAHNPETVERTFLGLLDALKIIRLIDENNPVILKEGDFTAAIIGKPYFYEIDKNPENYIVKERPDADCVINMMHGLLMEKAFIDGIDYVTLDQIKDTLADITLVGHYHTGFQTFVHEGRYFINPGSIARLSLGSHGKKLPKVVILDLGKGKLDVTEKILKSAQQASVIFDEEKVKQSAFKVEVMRHFQNLADNTVDFDRIDFLPIISELAKADNLGEDIIKETITRIGKAQELRMNR